MANDITPLILKELSYEHGQMVSKISELLAKKAKQTPDTVKLIRDAAALHDIGKQFVPEKILNKKGKLSPEEYQIVQRHAVLGSVQIIQQIKTLFAAAIVALQHHEHVNGQGYSGGVTNIHAYAKIVAVADVFDALISKRPYKEEWSTNEITGYIKENAGTQFEADYVNVLIDSLDEILELYKFKEQTATQSFIIT